MTSRAETDQLEAVERFAEDARQRFAEWVEDLILFGSRARDTATLASDWDVLAVIRGRDPPLESELFALAFDYLLSDRVNISIKILTCGERARQTALGVPFVQNVARDGRSLWTRTTSNSSPRS